MGVWSQPDNMYSRHCLILLFVLTATCIPADAAWTNEIVLNENGMVWEYTDIYDHNTSILFRTTIDAFFGNNDSYVSAWELMKVDASTRDHFRTSLSKQMDVSKNGSSTDIHPMEFNAYIDRELLGRVDKTEPLKNTYAVTYVFDRPLLRSSGDFSFTGEPHTELTISFPEDTRISSTDGIDNATMLADRNVTSVKGWFDWTGIANVEIEM